MVPSDEFLRHAAECESMARFSRDSQSKAMWSAMAQRWCRCAELAKQYNPPMRKEMKVKQHRRAAYAWAAQ
jgi:hypothetical protein